MLAKLVCIIAAAFPVTAGAQAEANYFGDPFLRVTEGIAACPVPPVPRLGKADMLAQSHSRVERGNFASSRAAAACRIPICTMKTSLRVSRRRSWPMAALPAPACGRWGSGAGSG